jgi:DNA-binding MarR family transcriptional regulator
MKNINPLSSFYTPDNYSPQGSVAFLMLRNKSNYQRLGDLKLADLGITAAQMSVLLLVSHAEHATISSLTQCLGVNAAATVRVVQKLEKMGLIQKAPSKKDRRVIGLSLTTAGKKTAKLIPPLWCDLLNQSLSGFTKKEFEQLREYLLRIEKNTSRQLEVRL